MSYDEIHFLLIVAHVHFTDIQFATSWKQACLEENELTLWRLQERGEAPRQSVTRVVKQCVDSTHQRIVSVKYVVLVWFPTVHGCCLVESAYRYHSYILVESNVGRVPLVV